MEIKVFAAAHFRIIINLMPTVNLLDLKHNTLLVFIVQTRLSGQVRLKFYALNEFLTKRLWKFFQSG